MAEAYVLHTSFWNSIQGCRDKANTSGSVKITRSKKNKPNTVLLNGQGLKAVVCNRSPYTST